MTDNAERGDRAQTKSSRWQSIRKRLTSKQGILLMAMIAVMVIGSLALYLANIDWEQAIAKYRYPGIFVVMLVCNMTIILPLPGLALVATAPTILSLTGWNLFWLGVVATTGSALGESTSYFAGRWGRTVVSDKPEKDRGRVERLVRRYGGLTIFVFAATPLPFDIAGLVAGSLRMPFWVFLVSCWAGRLIKVLAVLYLGWGTSNLFF